MFCAMRTKFGQNENFVEFKMTELLTAAQMRAIEQAAIDSGAVTGLELMERAGSAVVEAICAEWPDLDTPAHLHGTSLRARWARYRARRSGRGPRVGVLCGPGNNGGDGFVIARLLADRGWTVEVFFLGPPSRQPPDARTCGTRWFRSYRQMHVLVPGTGRDDRLSETRFDLFVDALFGIGLSRPLPVEVTDLLRNINYERNWQDNKLVAVDILSGIDADTGAEVSPLPMAADLTVAFHAAKPGHVQGRGAELCGRLAVKDIGLPVSVPKLSPPEAQNP